MKFEKSVTVNLGDFNSVRLCVTDATSFLACDHAIISELQRIKAPENIKIKAILSTRK